jgi:hypothetical protein
MQKEAAESLIGSWLRPGKWLGEESGQTWQGEGKNVWCGVVWCGVLWLNESTRPVKFKRAGTRAGEVEGRKNSDNSSRHARGSATMNQPVEEKEERRVKNYQGPKTKTKTVS